MGKMIDLPALEVAISSTTPLNVNVVSSVSVATNAKVFNLITDPTPGTPLDFAFPTGTKRFTLIPGEGTLTLTYNSPSETTTIEVPLGAPYNETDLNTIAGLTLTMQSTLANDTLTLIIWT